MGLTNCLLFWWLRPLADLSPQNCDIACVRLNISQANTSKTNHGSWTAICQYWKRGESSAHSLGNSRKNWNTPISLPINLSFALSLTLSSSLCNGDQNLMNYVTFQMHSDLNFILNSPRGGRGPMRQGGIEQAPGYRFNYGHSDSPMRLWEIWEMESMTRRFELPWGSWRIIA
jgi:hypothetical protein